MDFREINIKLRRQQFPLTPVDTILDRLAGHKYYTQLDFCQAYLAVEIDEESRHITQFRTRQGAYSFNRLPAGISVAPAVFCELIQRIFNELLWVEVLSF